MKLSTLLHKAADQYLAASREEWLFKESKNKFSCCAVIYSLNANDISKYIIAVDFLTSLGVDVQSSHNFNKFGYDTEDFTEELQGVRYLWLKLAAKVAEDEKL
jgi:hypothetical protein